MAIKIRYIILFFIALLAYIFIPDNTLDLYQYYNESLSESIKISVSQFIEEKIDTRFDFIYFLSFNLIRRFGLSINIVNLVYVFMFYFQSMGLLNDYIREYKLNDKKGILLANMLIFVSVPFIYVFSISRMVASFTFFFYAIRCLNKNRMLLFLLFLFLTLFTHIGSIIYIFMFLVARFIISPYIKISSANIVLFGSLLMFFLLNMLLNPIVDIIGNFSFFESYSYFKDYLQEFNGLNFEGQSRITTVATLWFVVSIIIYSYKSNIVSGKFKFSIYVTMFIILGAFMNNMFLQRAILFATPFNSILMLNGYNKSRSIIYVLMFLITVTISILLYLAFLFNGFFI